MNKPLLVIFGATGDLVKRKIFPILDSIDNIQIITYSRKDPKTKYTALIGDFDNLSTLQNYIVKHNCKKLYFYLALPPNLFFDLINKIMQSFKNNSVNIALEKPFGASLENAIILSKLIIKYGKDNFYLVDHYMAKDTIINFVNSRSKIITKEIKSIEIYISETDNLEKRGAFFDKVGIIKDIVQSHILLLVGLILNNKINEKNFILNKKSIRQEQFDGYKNIEGVDPHSKTETLFYGEFKYKQINIKIFSAKGQAENKKFAKIVFFDDTNYVLNIDQAKTKAKLPHQLIINDFIKDCRKYSIKPAEVISQWRIVESI